MMDTPLWLLYSYGLRLLDENERTEDGEDKEDEKVTPLSFAESMGIRPTPIPAGIIQREAAEIKARGG